MKVNANLPNPAWQETKKHTDFMFPYNVYLCTIPDDFPSVFLHWQDTMEIIYIKKGAGMAQVDLSTFEIHAGDMVFVPPGHLHGLNQLEGQRMEYENIIFDMEFLGSGVVDLCAQKYLLPLKMNQMEFPICIRKGTANYEKIAACLDDADELCDRRYPGFELGVKADIMQLFSRILRICNPKEADGLYYHPDNAGSASETSSPAHLERLKAAVNYIETHYQEPIRIQDAALECGYSESHFMRWFRQMTGMSFIRYLNRYRLENAFTMLRSTDKTVLEISEEVGFDNLSNFNRQFKKLFGVTPRELRET